MENLHSDITFNILSRLPVESVLHSKRVCKTWRSLLGHDTKVGVLFSIALHQRLSTGIQLYYGEHFDDINNIIIIDDDEQQYCCDSKYKNTTLTKIDHSFIQRSFPNFVMLGSCNGLVCFFVLHHGVKDPVYICNPITGEHVHLPRIDLGTGITYHTKRLVSGFGYCHSTNDQYKVVRIYFEVINSYRVGKVEVYTLGSGNGWRNIGDITYFFRAPGIFANGALHWLDYRERCKIVAFDLADEEFRLIPPPPCNFSSVEVQLILLGGNLCVSHQDRGNCVDIWALKKKKKKKKKKNSNSNSSYDVKEQDYDNSWSWSKEFNIVWEGQRNACYEPFALTKSNEVLLWYNGFLSCYDPKTATLKKLLDDDTAWLDVQAIPHMNSLVSLKALGENSDKEDNRIS